MPKQPLNLCLRIFKFLTSTILLTLIICSVIIYKQKQRISREVLIIERELNDSKIYVNYFNKAKVNYQNMIHNLEKRKEEGKRSFESLQNQEQKLIEEIRNTKRSADDLKKEIRMHKDKLSTLEEMYEKQKIKFEQLNIEKFKNDM